MNISQHAPQVTAVPPMLYDTAVTIRPARPDDVQAILDMHRRLSSNSLYLRYLVPYLPDYVPAHLRAVCRQSPQQGATLVAVHEGQVIGFGYYIIKPEQPDTAEPALLIEDQFQGQGIGKRLLNQLITAARAQGVIFFDALTHNTNQRMLRLLNRSGQQVGRQRDGSHVAILLSLKNDTPTRHFQPEVGIS
jgi:L-amino acid N-acyltransferase YncA